MSQPTASETVRMSLARGRAYTLPAHTRQISILSGGAWVSLGLNDIVAHRHENINLHPGRQAVTVTPLGEDRLEFLMIA